MSLIYFIILLGALVFVHELGHFLAAKSFKVYVQKFSLGFGPRLIGFRKGETEYLISALPLGGYVKMLGETPGTEIPEEMRHRAFNYKKPWQRLIIILAGPVFNLIFPVAIYFFHFSSHETITPPVVGMVLPGSPAEKVGLQPGDTIVRVNGKEVGYWANLQRAVEDKAGQSISLDVDRQGEILQVKLTPESQIIQESEGLQLRGGKIGISPVFLGAAVGVLDREGPAWEAGLRSWDRIVSLDGEAVGNWVELEEALVGAAGKRVILVVERGGDDGVVRVGAQGAQAAAAPVEPLTLSLAVPADIDKLGPQTAMTELGFRPSENLVATVEEGSPAQVAGLKRGDLITSVNGEVCGPWFYCEQSLFKNPNREQTIGFLRAPNDDHGKAVEGQVAIQVQVKEEIGELKEKVKRPVFGAVNISGLVQAEQVPNPNRITYAASNAYRQNIEVIEFTVKGLGLLIQGKVPASSIGGPIMIFDIAGKAGSQGLASFLWVMALISINLGIINLLPVPVLDGGHVAFIFIELVSRRPVSENVRAKASYVGLILLVGLMIFAFSNDIIRYWDDLTGYFRS